jgi:hypothetical protein
MVTNQAKMDMNQEKMKAEIHSLRAWRKDLWPAKKWQAWLECKEPTPEDTESETEHQELPKEHAAVGTGRVPNKQLRDWHLAEKFPQDFAPDVLYASSTYTRSWVVTLVTFQAARKYFSRTSHSGLHIRHIEQLQHCLLADLWTFITFVTPLLKHYMKMLSLL